MTTILETNDLKKHYDKSSLFSKLLDKEVPAVKAVDGVDIKLQDGETLGIVGESGSGKSTLIEIIVQLITPTEGNVLFRDEDIGNYSKEQTKYFRQNAQIIFQDPYGSLNPNKTVYQTVREPLVNLTEYQKEEIDDRVLSILHEVGLRPPDMYLDRYPDHLSGGQRQRINVARAVATDPDLLVADEPVSMLDVSLQSSIVKMLNRIGEQHDFSMIYVSHNISLVKLISDRIAVMYKGKIVEEGDADQIIDTPKHPYTQALVSCIPEIGGSRERVILPESETENAEVIGCNFHPRCPECMPHCRESVPELNSMDNRQVACFLYD